MNGSGKSGVTPQHVLQSAPGILRSVSAGPLGEEVRRGKSGYRQEKRDEELFRHDRSVINRRILQAALVDLPANDQSKQRNGLGSGGGVVVCVFRVSSVTPLLPTSLFLLPFPTLAFLPL